MDTDDRRLGKVPAPAADNGQFSEPYIIPKVFGNQRVKGGQ